MNENFFGCLNLMVSINYFANGLYKLFCKYIGLVDSVISDIFADSIRLVSYSCLTYLVMIGICNLYFVSQHLTELLATFICYTCTYYT